MHRELFQVHVNRETKSRPSSKRRVRQAKVVTVDAAEKRDVAQVGQRQDCFTALVLAESGRRGNSETRQSARKSAQCGDYADERRRAWLQVVDRIVCDKQCCRANG
jgi:hypothetical protein